jgi:tetratricopeptide (TPR) repeat protein
VPKDAQDYIYDAMEEWPTEIGLAALKKALKLDPDHPDGLSLLSETAESPEEALAMLDAAEASAIRRMGATFEKKYKGLFWLELDTRPYMRVILAKAEILGRLDRRKEAIALHEYLLKLNPNDNQGVRYPAIGLMLAERMLPKARKILERYPDDPYAWITWGKVLYYFVMKDRATATKLLKRARTANPFMEEFLLGKRELPDFLPDYYSLGSEEEAVLATYDLMEAWGRRQHALMWLNGQVYGDTAMRRYIARMIDGR